MHVLGRKVRFLPPLQNTWDMTAERQEIVKDILRRMDEICPAEDINIVEGELVDSLMDGALTNFLLFGDIRKIPCVKEVSYPGEKAGVLYVVEDGVFSVPDDYVRMAWVRCPEWKRALYEEDLMESGSMAWKMQSFKFRQASPLKPSVVILPAASPGYVRFKVSPWKEEVTFAYVARRTPEELKKEVDTAGGFWQSWLWYCAFVVLTAMGEPDLAALALQHAQAYQVIRSGMPLPSPERKKG